MTGVELRHGAATDVGRVREANEDAFLVAPPVFVVADGMGGHDRGDVASRIVVEQFAALAEDGYDPERAAEAVAATLRRCERAIGDYDAAQRAEGARDFAAGTTAVVLVLTADPVDPVWLLANVGDSRAYRLRAGRLDQLSVDHSLVQQLVDSGAIAPEEAAVHPERHVVTRALGGTGHVEADYLVVPVVVGDRLLLCSDGVSGMLEEAAMAALLAETPDASHAADALVAAAVSAGGHDNATAVVVDVAGLQQPGPA